VQASAFVGSDDDFSAGHALGLGDFGEDGLAVLDGFLGILEEQLAGSGERDAASRAVEEARADFFFERANLGGNGGLSAKTLLRRAREAGEARYFEKDFQLIEVHGVLGVRSVADVAHGITIRPIAAPSGYDEFGMLFQPQLNHVEARMWRPGLKAQDVSIWNVV